MRLGAPGASECQEKSDSMREGNANKMKNESKDKTYSYVACVVR